MSAASFASSEGIEIIVTYISVATRPSPGLGVDQWTAKQVWQLAGDTIRYSYEQNGVNFGTDEARLGENWLRRTPSGGKFNRTIRMIDGAIVSTEEYGSYIITEIIKIDGHSACSVSRRYKLKPGYKLFDDAGGNLWSKKQAKNLTCTIHAMSG